MKMMVDRLQKRFPHYPRLRLSRWIQHWTNVKLLTPEPTTIHKGTGKARLYSVHELYIASILSELSPYTIPVGRLLRIVHRLRKEEELVGFLDDAAKGKRWFILISYPFGGDSYDLVVYATKTIKKIINDETFVPLFRQKGGPNDGKALCAANVLVLRLDYLFGRL